MSVAMTMAELARLNGLSPQAFFRRRKAGDQDYNAS